MKKSLIVLCLLGLVVLVACRDGGSGSSSGGDSGSGSSSGGSTSSGDHDGDGDGDDSDDRDVRVNNKGDEVEVESESKDGSDSKFRFRLRVKDNGLRVEIESESEDEDEKSERNLRVYFERIVQYNGAVSADYSDAAHVGTDYVLATAEWNSFQCTSGTKYTCTASTKDNVFEAIFEVSGQDFQSNTTVITPEQLKITININDFSYSNSDNNTRLALLVSGRAKVEYKTDAAKQVGIGASAFAWIDTAVADGVDIKVANSPAQTSTEGEEKKFSLAFSFEANRPTNIYWDPTIGTTSAPASSSGSFLTPVNFVVAGLALLGLNRF